MALAKIRTSDHAILVVDVEVFDVDRAGLRALEHDRQAVDGDPLLQHLVAHDRNRRALIVDAVAGHIDHPPQARGSRTLEQRLRKLERAGDRGSVGAPVRRVGDLVGEGARGCRAVDHPPRHDDALVSSARPSK